MDEGEAQPGCGGGEHRPSHGETCVVGYYNLMII